jgi:hypothetical protein
MPERYEVRIMVARILVASPPVAATMEDLNRPPVVRRVRQEEAQMRQEETQARDPALDRIRRDRATAQAEADVRQDRETARAEDASVGWNDAKRDFDTEDHLQGY